MPDVSVHVRHVTITRLSCEYDVEQQEVEENKVDKKEELGLRGSSIQTNQDNAERRDRGRVRERIMGIKTLRQFINTYFGFLTRR